MLLGHGDKWQAQTKPPQLYGTENQRQSISYLLVAVGKVLGGDGGEAQLLLLQKVKRQRDVGDAVNAGSRLPGQKQNGNDGEEVNEIEQRNIQRPRAIKP